MMAITLAVLGYAAVVVEVISCCPCFCCYCCNIYRTNNSRRNNCGNKTTTNDARAFVCCYLLLILRFFVLFVFVTRLAYLYVRLIGVCVCASVSVWQQK